MTETRQTNRLAPLFLLSFALALVMGGSGTLVAEDRPNIVFIMADDLGWSDLSCYGSSYYRTPNLDALAAGGMTFSDAYTASPVCSPTRASLMTGQYPTRHGFTGALGHIDEVRLEARLRERAPADQSTLEPASATRLDTDHLTYAEVLREAGYRTAHIGKWHMGPAPYSPLEHGFNLDIPHAPSAPGPGLDGYLHPWPVWPGHGESGDHLEERMASEAAAFIREMAGKDEPFYLSYWMWEVHTPLQDREARIDRYARQADPDDPQRNPVYAAMVETMDRAVGTVIDALEASGQRENTLVLFYSDNGGVTRLERAVPEPYRHIPPTSNRPLRGGKFTIYEGGFRVPLIASWPGRIPAGTNSDALVTSVDFYPLFLDVADIPAPPDQALDGESFLSVLEGRENGGGRGPIIGHWPHRFGELNEPSTFIRQGPWKLIRFYADGPNQADRLELYHLGNDTGETTDLAARYPERAAALDARLQQHLAATDAVVPAPNPDYRGEVFGWRGGGDAALAAGDGTLLLHSSGKDPFFYTEEVPPIVGPVTLTFRYRSDLSGRGEVFHTIDQPGGRRFAPTRSKAFSMVHDDTFHTATIRFETAAALTGLRIDPGRGTGTVRFDSIRLTNPAETEEKTWNFQ